MTLLALKENEIYLHDKTLWQPVIGVMFPYDWSEMFLRKLTLSGLWCLYRKEELIFKPLLPTARRMASNIEIARLKPPNILIQETNDNQKEQLIQMFERVRDKTLENKLW